MPVVIFRLVSILLLQFEPEKLFLSKNPQPTTELPFTGFKILIKRPLEKHDQQSFKNIKQLLLQMPADVAGPISFLLYRLAGKSFPESSAVRHWQQLLQHKQQMELKLQRVISIQTAVVDYFSLRHPFYAQQNKPPAGSTEPDKSVKPTDHTEPTPPQFESKMYGVKFEIERLKHEINRSRRYQHTLSALLVDIDKFRVFNQDFSHNHGTKLLAAVARIIHSLIRSVDILCRYEADTFLVILPSTNKREAIELAERLRISIYSRSENIENWGHKVSVSVAADQVMNEENSKQFLKKLHTLLSQGKQKGPNMVHST